MGMFDFLKKKKEPEFPAFTEPRIPGEDIGLPPERPGAFESRPMEMPQMERMDVPMHRQSQDSQVYAKDLELISAKLDSVKATLDAVNQRLANLERIAAGETREKYF